MNRKQEKVDGASWLDRPWTYGIAMSMLVLATWAIYYPVKDFDFINFDDPGYVFENPYVSQGLTWEGVKWSLTTGEQSNWHPLTWWSHMLDSELYGVEYAGGHHITNVWLHVVNSVLVFILWQRMTAAFWRPLFVAAIFALHPLHVESVAWVSERKDVLSACLGLASLIAYAEYAGHRRGNVWLVITGICLALGLMAKPMLVTLPFVMLLLDIWPLQRWKLFTNDVSGETTTVRQPQRSRKKKTRRNESVVPQARTATEAGPNLNHHRPVSVLFLEKLPLFVVIVGSSLVTYMVQHQGGAVGTAIPWQHRLATAVIAYVRYLWKTFVPTRLALLYPNHEDMWAAWQIAGAAMVLVIITLFVLLQRKKRYLLIGWFWFLGVLFPVCGIIQIGLHSLADRYMYVPMIGILVMVAWAAADLVYRWPRRKMFFVMVGLSACVACMSLSTNQVRHWQNSFTLYKHTVSITYHNYVMHNNLGDIFQQRDDLTRAIQQYQLAVKSNPTFDKGLTNLGNALRIAGDVTAAEDYLRQAIDVSPKNAVCLNNLGILLQETARMQEAIDCYQQALKHDPHYNSALNNLGVALFRQGRFDEALSPLHRAIQIDPRDGVCHNSLAAVYQSLRRYDEAIQHCQIALQINPQDASAHGNWGICLIEQSQLQAAIDHFRRAVKIDPNDKIARSNLRAAEAKLRKESSD